MDEDFKILEGKSEQTNYLPFEEIQVIFKVSSPKFLERVELILENFFTAITKTKIDAEESCLMIVLKPIETSGKHDLLFNFLYKKNKVANYQMSIQIDELKAITCSKKLYTTNEEISLKYDFGKEVNIKDLKFDFDNDIAKMKEQIIDENNGIIMIILKPVEKIGNHELPYNVYRGKKFIFTKTLMFEVEKIKWTWDKITIGDQWKVENNFVLTHSSDSTHTMAMARSENLVKSGAFEIKIRAYFGCCGYIGIGFNNQINIKGQMPQKCTYSIDPTNGSIFKGTTDTTFKTSFFPKETEGIIGMKVDLDKKSLRFYVEEENSGVTLENIEFGDSVFVIVDAHNVSRFKFLND